MNYTVPENMKACPGVFAVEDSYQIFIPFSCDAVVWIEINGKCYYDDSNGILRSNSLMHRIDIPMKELDAAGEYTVVYRKMLERKPYFSVSEEPIRVDFKFYPVKGDKIKIYNISDAHNMEIPPINAAKAFGEDIDLLILNGDIPNDSGNIENFNSIYIIASAITGGTKPVIFSRGNHDTRGIYGENFAQYTPGVNGKPYYTFKLGSVWGMVLDCGEDKPDDHEEYANTVCFHNYRINETRFIDTVIERAEFDFPEIKHKLIICHVPFIRIDKPPFDIEKELYREWTEKICKQIKPTLMLFGHTHKKGIHLPDSEFDSYKMLNCPAVVGSEPYASINSFIGCGITLSDGDPDIIFTSDRDYKTE